MKIPLRQVVKTLLLKTSADEFLLALCPGDRQVDLKLLAHLLKEKRIDLADRDESPQGDRLFHRRGEPPRHSTGASGADGFPSSSQEKEISISAGRWGCQILIDPAGTEGHPGSAADRG